MGHILETLLWSAMRSWKLASITGLADEILFQVLQGCALCSRSISMPSYCQVGVEVAVKMTCIGRAMSLAFSHAQRQN